MTTLAIVLVLIAALSHAFRDFFTKDAKDKQVFVWWMSVASNVIFFPFFIWALFQYESVPWAGIGFALAMGLVHSSYWVFYTKAYDGGDLSHVYPIIRSAPAFVLLFAVFFLKETVSLLGVLGILTTTFGLYVINLKKLNLKGFLEPFLSIKDVHMRFAFLALASGVAYSILDKVGITLLHPFSYAFIQSASAITIYSCFLYKMGRRKKDWVNTWKSSPRKVWAAGTVAVLNYPLVLLAMNLTNVSYVVAFRQVGVVFAVLIGLFILKEKVPLIRALGSSIIFGGAMLVAIA